MSYAVIDFETTGMSPALGARITEVGLCIVDNDAIVDSYQSLVNPQQAIPYDIQRLTGISDAMVRAAPGASTVMREVVARVEGLPLVAHNASFDYKFWQAELDELGLSSQVELLCSLKLARRLLPGLASYRLSELAGVLQLPQAGQFHRALADARCTAHLTIALQRQLCADYQLACAPTALLAAVQSVPKNRVAQIVERYHNR